jgi:hypothetical protein
MRKSGVCAAFWELRVQRDFLQFLMIYATMHRLVAYNSRGDRGSAGSHYHRWPLDDPLFLRTESPKICLIFSWKF